MNQNLKDALLTVSTCCFVIIAGFCLYLFIGMVSCNSQMNKAAAEMDEDSKRAQKQLDDLAEKQRRTSDALERKLRSIKPPSIQSAPAGQSNPDPMESLRKQQAQNQEQYQLDLQEQRRRESYQQQKWKAEAEQRANQERLRR